MGGKNELKRCPSRWGRRPLYSVSKSDRLSHFCLKRYYLLNQAVLPLELKRYYLLNQAVLPLEQKKTLKRYYRVGTAQVPFGILRVIRYLSGTGPVHPPGLFLHLKRYYLLS